jgi:hypothetical protein
MTMMRSLVLTFATIATHLVVESSAFIAVPVRQTRLTQRFSSPDVTPDLTPNKPEPVKIDILQPYLPAADPMYAVRGIVGDQEFVLERSGGPVAEELTNENIVKIVKIECSDLEVGDLRV